LKEVFVYPIDFVGHDDPAAEDARFTPRFT
jgi:hypothetical protein